MKKYLILFALLFCPLRSVHAVSMDVWLSSNTLTADSTATLCGQYQVGTSSVVFRGILHEVVVSSPAVGGVTLFNSSWTTVGTQSLGPVTTGGISQGMGMPYLYDVVFPNGLIYTKTGTAPVQFIYQCY